MNIGRSLRNHPRPLEIAYRASDRALWIVGPLLRKIGVERVERVINPLEHMTKKAIFDCRMCGQCVLHSTGMTCPMTCPKNLRNGPCGGVRANGHCEVKPEMKCIWVQAFERSQEMPQYGSEILHIQPPVNRQLEGESAWITMLTGVDKVTPKGWVGTSTIPVIGER
jgi:hypothetical protein